MFERFTPRARQAIVIAQEEAKRLQHDFIQPEHLLLALTQGDGIAARALGQLGVGVEQVRARITDLIKSLGPAGRDKIPFSPAAKKALERSLREALQLGHNYIGTEHLVLGALQVLNDGEVATLLGVDVEAVRSTVIALMPKGSSANMPQSPAAIDAVLRAAQIVGAQSSAASAAIRHAGQVAGTEPITTGHLLHGLLIDPRSQAAQALHRLGVTVETVEEQLVAVPIDGTSDAPPRPQIVEIKLGEVTTTIGDPDLAAALGDLSPEELRRALRDAIDATREQPDGGSEESA